MPKVEEGLEVKTEAAPIKEAEVKAEVEKIVHPTLQEYNRDKSFVAKAGFMKGAINRIEIVWPVPTTDEESQERYGKDLAYLILHGVMELSHAPNYAKTLGNDEYTEKGHKACQLLADNYKPGNRKTGETAQIKADAAAGNAARASANKLGFATLEEAMAFAAMAKEKDNKKASKSKTK